MTGDMHISINFVVVCLMIIAVTLRTAACQEHQVSAEYPSGVPAVIEHHCEPRDCK